MPSKNCRNGEIPFLHFWSEWRDSFASAPGGADRDSPPSSWRRQQSTGLLHLDIRVSHPSKRNKQKRHKAISAYLATNAFFDTGCIGLQKLHF